MKTHLGPLLAIFCCVLVLGGCETNPNSAFPTAPAVTAGGSEQGNQNLATLERGRKIYTTACTECHVARPIAHYSVAQWHHYVTIMAPRAALNPQDRAALEAYVVAARESLPNGSDEHSR
jgi:mono/diheme cytochrome c family protein